jgi:hypothetical protein
VEVKEQDLDWHTSPIVSKSGEDGGGESLRFKIVWLVSESDRLLVKDFWGRVKPKLDPKRRIGLMTGEVQRDETGTGFGGLIRNPFGFLPSEDIAGAGQKS